MKCVETIQAEVRNLQTPVPLLTAHCESVLLPKGLLGFEDYKGYTLTTNPGEEPFAWLSVEGKVSLAFVVIDPFIALPDYQPDIPQADVEFLGLKQPGDALLYGIVTLHEGRTPTVNLKGPVVVNRHTRIGKQVIIANATAYSVEHPLPVET